MPRQVDHAVRRREIIEALWQVTARDGLTAVSFRDVAAEASVSVRRVQYYFGTKANLLFSALQMLGERIVSRGLAAAEADQEPRSLLRAAVMATLPIDDESRTLMLLFLSFYVASLTDPSLSSAETLELPRWTGPYVAGLIRRAQPAGEAAPGVDPDKDALLLVSSITGLGLSMLAGIVSPSEATEAIDYSLGRILGRAPAKTARRSLSTD